MPDWQEILDRDGGAVWHIAYRYLGNRADAEECFQEAFLAAFEVSRRQEVQNWRALLKHLITARAVDCLRRRRHQAGGRNQLPDWDRLPDHAPTPHQIAEDAELSDRLRGAVALLPPRQAEAFCLHCLEGASYQEVAQQMAVSVDAVGVLVYEEKNLVSDHENRSRGASGRGWSCVLRTASFGRGDGVCHDGPKTPRSS